jgi:hypothetical protein
MCCARLVCPRVSSSKHGQGGSHTNGGTPYIGNHVEGCHGDVIFSILGTGGAALHQAQPVSQGE